MRIAWLIQGDEQWGIRSGSRALISALEERGVQCPVIALQDGEFTEECKSRGLDVRELHDGPVPMFGGGLTGKLSAFVKLTRFERRVRDRIAAIVEDLSADAIHFRRPNLVGIAGQAARTNGLPAYWHMPNAINTRYPFQLNRRSYQRRCHRYGIVPLANSRYTASTLGSRPVTPRVLYLAVDPDRFDPNSVNPISRQSLGIGPDATIIAVIARLFPAKGQDRAVNAVSRLIAEGHDIHLLLVGGPTSGAYYDQIQEQIGEGAKSEHFHFTGPVSDTERYYRTIDFSLNCRIDPEPCGISILESMMSATPALVHASGGPAETVVDGQTGWHYHGPSADDIHGGILRAIEDRARWSGIGAAARAHAIENFSLEAQASKYLQIVADTLGKPTIANGSRQ